MRVGLESVPRRSNEIVTAEYPGEIVVLSLLDSRYFAGGDCAASVWSRIDGLKSLEQICTELETEYAAPAAEIRRDVLDFILELAELRLIEV